jgi:lipoprotein signal peptidase
MMTRIGVRLRLPSRSFLADTFRLEYSENTGAFLSLGADWPRPLRTAVFVAGGASNLVDRITYGMVIDFMMLEGYRSHRRT